MMYGSPRMTSRSAVLTDAARTRTSTSSSPNVGLSISLNFRMSGDPYRSWTIAFTPLPPCPIHVAYDISLGLSHKPVKTYAARTA